MCCWGLLLGERNICDPHKYIIKGFERKFGYCVMHCECSCKAFLSRGTKKFMLCYVVLTKSIIKDYIKFINAVYVRGKRAITKLAASGSFQKRCVFTPTDHVTLDYAHHVTFEGKWLHLNVVGASSWKQGEDQCCHSPPLNSGNSQSHLKQKKEQKKKKRQRLDCTT